MSGKARRQSANQRFQGQVLDLAERLVTELRDLLGTDSDARDSAVEELDRLARQAHAVGLSRLAGAAEAAGRAVAAGASFRALALVRAAATELRGRPLVGGLVVLASARLASSLKRAALYAPEPVQVLGNTDELDTALAGRPDGVVLPFEAREWLPRVRAMTSGPVLLYGDQVLERLPAAIDVGAQGLLPASFDLHAPLEKVRRYRETADPQGVVLFGGETYAREEMASDLAQQGWSVVNAADEPALLAALEDEAPDGIVMLQPTERQVRLARAHPRGGVPLLVVGGDPQDLTVAGADEVLAWGDPRALAQRMRARVGRCALELCRWTGLSGRTSVLRQVERLHADAHRRGKPLSLVLFALSPPEGAARKALVAGASALAKLLATNLRRTDPLGVLNLEHFVAALPGVYLDVAARRVAEIERRFERMGRESTELVGWRLRVGLADNEVSPDRLFARAEESLRGA